MPVVCKFPKRNNWLGTTLIIKVDDNLPISLHLTYFFHWICNCSGNLESDAQWVKIKNFWFKHPGYDPSPPRPPPPCHIKMFSVCFQWCSFHHWQGFVQEISGKWLKKLNLLIEFWNSIFIKFYFKAYCHWTCIQKCFRGFTPNSNQSFAMDLLRSLQHLKMPTCIL